MQESSPTYPWTHPLALVLAGILGWLARVVYRYTLLYLGRHKPRAETDEITARTQKTLAEARRIHVRSDTEVSNVVLEVTSRIMEMQEENEVVRKERDRLEQQVALQAIELKSYESQIRKMEGFIKVKGLSYSDADKT